MSSKIKNDWCFSLQKDFNWQPRSLQPTTLIASMKVSSCNTEQGSQTDRVFGLGNQPCYD